jgi:hypothetical protein
MTTDSNKAINTAQIAEAIFVTLVTEERVISNDPSTIGIIKNVLDYYLPKELNPKVIQEKAE